MSRSRLTTATHLVLLAAILQGSAPGAHAEQIRRSPRKSQPVPPAHAAPDTTATIAARKPPPADDETIPPPFYLPAAPRARMHACGERWQGIKMSGKAGDQTWRDFATKCLVEADRSKKAP